MEKLRSLTDTFTNCVHYEYMDNSVEFLPGLRIGHAQDEDALTGCTVVLCEEGAVAGMDQRGGASGTRQTDSLHPGRLVEQVHGVVLSGGSAFGLDTASGAVRYLEEKGVGLDVRVARIPILPTAILFDLGLGKSNARPGPEMGYQACLNAHPGWPAEGCVGAGTGATVGKINGIEFAMKSGIGCSRLEVGAGLIVCAVVAVNAFGDIIDPVNGEIIAGARRRSPTDSKTGVQGGDGQGIYADSLEVMRTLIGRTAMGFASRENTVIGVVATNAQLNKEHINKVAQMAHDGLARTVRPAHTMLDGDTIFALSIGSVLADVNIVGAYAAEAFAQAVLRAVRHATPAGGLPAVSSL
jgi:L-aminopeptidase/D-esterase-like protein